MPAMPMVHIQIAFFALIVRLLRRSFDIDLYESQFDAASEWPPSVAHP